MAEKTVSNSKSNHKKSFPALILFADIIGSVDYADTLPVREYQHLLSDFHETTRNILDDKEIEKKYYKVRGDELFLIIKCKEPKNGNDYLSYTPAGHKEMIKIVDIARELKTKWLVSDFNSKRVEENKHPIDLAVGINFGYLWNMPGENINAGSSNEISQESHSISLAKRVEYTAREKGHYTRIMFSSKAYQIAVGSDIKVYWTSGERVELKGMSQGETIYEIRCFYEWVYWAEIIPDVDKLNEYTKLFMLDYSNSWLGIMIASSYFLRNNIPMAINILEKLLLVNKDFPVAWVLLCKCYNLKATDIFIKEQDKSVEIPDMCEIYLKRAEMAINRAEELDRFNEEVFIERGLVYYDWAIMLDILHFNLKETNNIESFSEKATKLRSKAEDAFEKGTIYGVGKMRSAYWLTIMKIEDKDDIKPKNVLEILFASIGIELPDNEDNRIEILKKKAGQYFVKALLKNYKANVYMCYACLLYTIRHDDAYKSKIYGDNFKKLSVKFLKKSIKEISDLADDNEASFTTPSGLPKMMPIKDFIEECKVMIQIVNEGGKPLIPVRGKWKKIVWKKEDNKQE
ncbi:MAG: hypothetical protein HQK96_18600 [Nitrospirae bacterium]|nr:hypothetical protein [Nitrospirota bacterium]